MLWNDFFYGCYGMNYSNNWLMVGVKINCRRLIYHFYVIFFVYHIIISIKKNTFNFCFQLFIHQLYCISYDKSYITLMFQLLGLKDKGHLRRFFWIFTRMWVGQVLSGVYTTSSFYLQNLALSKWIYMLIPFGTTLRDSMYYSCYNFY